MRIKRERERKPSSYCLRTCRSMMNYSRIIGEAPMRMMNPSVMVFRLDLVVLELAGAGIVFFLSSLGFPEYLGIYRVKRRCRRSSRGAQPPGRAWASWHALVGYAHPGPPLWYFVGPLGVFWSKRFLQKSFAVFGLCLVLIFCEVKNKQNNNWHRALCQ